MSKEPKESMNGKTVLITGATSGIGEATALALAKRGARLVLVARNADRAAQTRTRILQEARHYDVHFIMADLSSQDSIRELARRFQEKFDRLDVLINNAGGAWNKRTLTVDGLEMTFAVDYLAYFLLTHLLLDVLKASAPSRIINVSSAANLQGHIHFDDLQGEHLYQPYRAYGQAKLAGVMFTYELARRLQGTGVTVNCLHPGVVRTRIWRQEGSVLLKLFEKFYSLFMLSPEQGAATSVYLATARELTNVTGAYFDKQKAVASNPFSYDLQACKRLWTISENLTGLHHQSGSERERRAG